MEPSLEHGSSIVSCLVLTSLLLRQLITHIAISQCSLRCVHGVTTHEVLERSRLIFSQRVGRIVLDGVLNPIFLATEETTAVCTDLDPSSTSDACDLLNVFFQFWPKQLMDADRVYNAYVTACALAGPDGCSIATQGQTPVEVDADIQALLQQAHDAARKNSSVPVTSADFRGECDFRREHPGFILFAVQHSLAPLCTHPMNGRHSRM